MKSLKKLDKYLLENHPLLWHSKLLYALLVGCFLHILLFVLAFFTIDLKRIETVSLDRYYANSYLFMLHMVLVLCLIVIWAISFFRKNAIRHLYPIRKGYFSILFLHLFIGLVAITLPYLSVIQAFKSKTKQLTQIDKIKEDFETYKIAQAFLVERVSDYDLDNKMAPSPFPIEHLYFDQNSKSWNGSNLYIYSDTAKHTLLYAPDIHTENNDTIEGKIYQFYTSKQEVYSGPCFSDEKTIITSFVKPTKSGHFYSSSLMNFSGQADYRNMTNFSREKQTNQIQKIISEKGQKGIIDQLTKFKRILECYKIQHQISPEIIGKYVFENRNNITVRVTQNYWNASDPSNLKPTWGNFKVYLNQNDSYNQSTVFGYESNQLYTLFENAQWSNYEHNHETTYYFLICISAFIAFFLLIFEFTPFLYFLLTVPIAGVLVIVNAIIFYFILSFFRGRFIYLNYDQIALWQVLVNFALMYLLLYLSVRKFKRKKLSAFLLNICYGITPFVPMVIILVLDGLTKYRHTDKCGSQEIVYSFWHDLIHPLPFLVAGFILFIWFLRWVKKFYALPD